MIFTGYFGQLKKITGEGKIPISIARYNPPYYNGKAYKRLAPTGDMLKMGEDDYIRKFHTILRSLNPVSVREDLMSMAEGRDIVLLCYEGPWKFCHRHLVSQWLNKHFPELRIKEFEPKASRKKLADSQMRMF